MAQDWVQLQAEFDKSGGQREQEPIDVADALLKDYEAHMPPGTATTDRCKVATSSLPKSGWTRRLFGSAARAGRRHVIPRIPLRGVAVFAGWLLRDGFTSGEAPEDNHENQYCCFGELVHDDCRIVTGA